MTKELSEKFYIDPIAFDKDSLQARFVYRLGEHRFVEHLQLDSQLAAVHTDLAVIESLLYHCSIALGVSYYKLTPAREIVITDGWLTKQQRHFWQQFYKFGLGEYWYTNRLDPHRLVSVHAEWSPEDQLDLPELRERCLVPFGGGKDSMLASALLDQWGYDQLLFSFGRDYPVHAAAAQVTWHPRVVITRTIDPFLIELSQSGDYYNGHVPITGMIHFIALLVAYLYDYQTIVWSNESSADRGNTVWKEMEINHQWSKSSAFEQAFARYLHGIVGDQLSSFSLLRPRHELRIAKEFGQISHYLPVFSSCNRNFHLTDRSDQLWCMSCPKCLFTYMMLRPFLSVDQVVTIWWDELYADEGLWDLAQQLWGVSGIKPFECVGRYEECQVASWLARHTNEELRDLPILDWFGKHLAAHKTPAQREKLEHRLLASRLPDWFPWAFAGLISS